MIEAVGLRLRLAEREAVLTAGVVAEFNTHVPHAIADAVPGPVEMLRPFGPQGERLHVRASAGRTAR